MKIAIVDPSGFTVPYDRHLCAALADAGCDVRFFSDNDQTEDVYTDVALFYRLSDRLFGSADTAPQKGFKGLEYISDNVRFLQRLREWNPDVIHYQWLPLPLVDYPVLVMLSRLASLVLTLHDSNPFHGSETSRLQFLGMRRAMKAFDAYIAHTSYTKRQFSDFETVSEQISIVPHGILDYPAIETSSTDGSTLLFFGNIKQYKGLDVLVRALGTLSLKALSETTLVVAGQPHIDMEPIRRLAVEKSVDDSIEWNLGYVPDENVPKLFDRADVVVLPYREIDQSGVLLTAVGYGVPVVATDIGGFGEFLNDGVHGRLVPPEEPAALAAAIRELLADEAKRDKMSKAMERLAEENSWSSIAERTIDVYRAALCRNNGKD